MESTWPLYHQPAAASFVVVVCCVYQKASRMRDGSEEGMKKVLDLPGRAQVVYITNKYIRGSFSWGNRSIVRCYTRKMLDYTEAGETGYV